MTARSREPVPRPSRNSVLLGAGVFALGSLAMFLLMSNEAQLPHGPLWGLLATMLAAGGLLWALGLHTHPSLRENARAISETALGALPGERVFQQPKVAVSLAVAVLIVGTIAFSPAALPFILPVALLALVPACIERPGLLVFVVVSAVYLPLLGTYSLSDPWETHYGEVAREILSRDDWISLWWAQENWFWSKPILIFWVEALSMAILGVDFHPDANPTYPEWAVRLPVFLMSIGAVLAVYAAMARAFNRRAGVLAALALATMPLYFLLAHQAITDMPFVANMTIAMSLLVLALTEDPDREVRGYRIGKVVVSAQHAVIFTLVLIVLPQILYLASRNVTLVGGFRFAWHRDTFMYGSAGNSNVPGNASAYDLGAYHDGIFAQPISQALYWAIGLGLLVWMLRRERRAQGLYMFAFYVFCGLSFMAKGIPGFALPGLVALLFMIGSRRWDLLLAGKLRVAAGALAVAVVGLPWYVAMYIRHGPPFTERLLVHDHLNRLASGVHGDTGSIQYFIDQLGYGLFPWLSVAPAAVLGWLWLNQAGSVDDEGEQRRRDTLVLISMWFFGAFTLFNAMITKFHHYIFPAVPPCAFAAGVLLDRMFGGELRLARSRAILATIAAVVSPMLLVPGIAGFFGDVRGVAPDGLTSAQQTDWVLAHPWNPLLSATFVALGVLLAAFAVLSFRRGADDVTPVREAFTTSALAAAIAGSAMLLAFVGRDLAWETAGRPEGNERLMLLFVYMYTRPWPEHLDYRPILTGFAIVATAMTAAGVFPRLRPFAGRALVGVALMFAAWGVNVYLVDAAPHWGQRELVKRYYALRESAAEPLVAWQMNWKGENFYSGNRVSVFADLDNKKIRDWMDQNRGRRAFFLFEHTRLGGFKGLVSGKEVRELTTKRDNNKFILVEVNL